MTPNPVNKPRIIRKIGLAHFKNKKMIMGRDSKNAEVFIMIGGKVEEGETDQECLIREVREELEAEVIPDSIKYLAEFNGPAHGHDPKEALLNIKLYEADFTGEPKTTEEIVEITYFDTTIDPKHLSEIGVTQIFPWLKEHNYIN